MTITNYRDQTSETALRSLFADISELNLHDYLDIKDLLDSYSIINNLIKSLFSKTLPEGSPNEILANIVTDYIPDCYLIKLVYNYVGSSFFRDYRENDLDKFLTDEFRTSKKIDKSPTEYAPTTLLEKREICMHILNNRELYPSSYLWATFSVEDVAHVCLSAYEGVQTPSDRNVSDGRDLFISSQRKYYSVEGIIKYHNSRKSKKTESAGRAIRDPINGRRFSAEDTRMILKLFVEYGTDLRTSLVLKDLRADLLNTYTRYIIERHAPSSSYTGSPTTGYVMRFSYEQHLFGKYGPSSSSEEYVKKYVAEKRAQSS